MKLTFKTIFILITSSLFSLAGKKAEVILEGDSTGLTSVADRIKEIGIKLQRDPFEKKDLPLEEKINALKSKLAFYELLKSYKIDPYKKIKLKYRDRLLTEALKELLPNIPVKFEGVEKDVTIRKMTTYDANLERVCEYLDDAAGVYFEFSQEGLVVIPEQKKEVELQR